MQIAIIDSGIDKNHKRLEGCNIGGLSIKKNKDGYKTDEEYDDYLGHGTGVASIIFKLAPKAKLIAVKIFHEELICEEDLVCEAIKWCIENNINIVNLSLGIPTSDPSPELHQICKLAFEKNIPVIAPAYKSFKQECYPAYFPEVFGVAGGNIKDRMTFGKIEQSPISFIAKGDMQRVASKNGSFTFAGGNSYACAYFTGIVCSFIKNIKKFDIAELKKLLLENANPDIIPMQAITKTGSSLRIIKRDSIKKVAEVFNDTTKFDWMKKIALFPVSEKEMKTFFTFRNLCKYEIIKFLDYPKVFKDQHIENVVQDWMPSDDDFDEFDTLILGYFHEHLFQGNVKYGFDLLKKAIKKNKNLFLFDNHLKKTIEKDLMTDEYKGKIYCPIVNKEDVEKIEGFPYNSRISTPIICIIGTSSKQGKFTSQLRLRALLENEGYKVSHISTEPHGELFGSEFSFPMGYNSTVGLAQDDWPFFLKSLNKAIEAYYHPDIILTGIQSWTITPFVSSRLSGTELRSIQFLLGIKPDAIICSINPNDSIEVIQRNTMAAQLVSRASVLFYTITPNQLEVNISDIASSFRINVLSVEELEKRIQIYQKELKKPVINILDESNNKLIIKLIQDFFQEE